MLEANVEEMPVVDADARVIADITIVDLLQHLLVSDAAAEASGGSNEPSPHDGS